MLTTISAYAQSDKRQSGFKLQRELFDWFNSQVENNADAAVAGDNPKLIQLQETRTAVRALLRLGWRLVMVDDLSVADKAGFDFGWFSPMKSWFPLDVKAVNEDVKCTLIWRVAVKGQHGFHECGQLTFECRVEFLELLLRLSQVTPPFDASFPPPSMVKCDRQKMLQGLIDFQKRLTAIGRAKPEGQAHRAWAEWLKRPIGFQMAAQRESLMQGTQREICDRVAKLISQAIGDFLNAPSKTMAREFLLHRGERRKYEAAGDIFALGNEKNEWVRITGVRQHILQTFEAAYAKHISAHGLTPGLIQKKRQFVASGVNMVISHVLDVLAFDERERVQAAQQQERQHHRFDVRRPRRSVTFTDNRPKSRRYQ